MQTLMNRNGAIVSTIAAGYLLGSRTIITATGSSTYTTPTGCRVIIVECFAGGGGGRSAGNSTAAQIILGGGGSAGMYTMSTPIVTSDAVTFTVNVGVGGAASTAGGLTNFISGGWTLGSANGGSAGATAIGTGTSEIFVAPTAGSAGSTANGWLIASGNGSLIAHRVSGTVAINGKGANGPLGGQPVCHKAQVATAAAGGNYGAGGSGGISVNAGGASTGGAGGQGLVIVWEFY